MYLSIKEVLRATGHGYCMQTGHASTGARDLSHTKHYGLQRQPEAELQGTWRRLPQAGQSCSETQTTHGKRAGERSWQGVSGRRTSTSSGNCCLHWEDRPRQRAPLTCDFKHVLIPFGIFQLCQHHSCQRQLSLGELKSSQCQQVCLFLLIPFSLEIAI